MKEKTQELRRLYSEYLRLKHLLTQNFKMLFFDYFK